MVEQIIVTLRAEKGGKFEETGQCIASYNRSIVFLPRSAKPDEVVRVRLIPIEGKKDRNDRVMYRAEYALPPLSQFQKSWIAGEAEALRRGPALPREQGEAILRAKGVAGGTSSGWYYFCDEGVFCSHLPPAALSALESLPRASEAGLIELLAWILDQHYYVRTQEQGIRDAPPELPNEKIKELTERLKRGERVLAARVN